MDDFKRLVFEKFLSPPGQGKSGKAEDYKAEAYKASSGDYVGTQNPYDRLRRMLRAMFPHYPDLFDINGGAAGDDGEDLRR